MPEIVDSQTRALLGELRKEEDLQEKKRILEAAGARYLNKGGESLIFIPNTNKAFDTLISLDHGEETKTIVEVKCCFYLSRILRTLFPHNFPTLRAVFGGRHPIINLCLSGAVRTQIFPAESGVQKKFPFSVVKDAVFKQMRLPISKFDSFHKNFIVGKDGGEYFVDIPRINHWLAARKKGELQWDIEAIVLYMTNNQYTKQEISRVLKNINRINGLMKDM